MYKEMIYFYVDGLDQNTLDSIELLANDGNDEFKSFVLKNDGIELLFKNKPKNIETIINDITSIIKVYILKIRKEENENNNNN